MKIAVFVAAVVVAIASFAAAEECSAITLGFAFLPLAPQAAKCAVDSSYQLYPFTGMPSLGQMRKMCKSDACKELLKETKAGDMPDCDITVNGTAYNVKHRIELISAGCTVSNIVGDIGDTLFGS